MRTKVFHIYWKNAQSLSSSPEMLEICRIIENDLLSFQQSDLPFMFIGGSSGMGKTQAAMTIMNMYGTEQESVSHSQNGSVKSLVRPKRRTLYFVMSEPRQAIYSYFSPRSSVFKNCLKLDKKFIEKRHNSEFSVQSIKILSLFTFGLICKLLEIFDDFSAVSSSNVKIERKSVDDVIEIINQKLGGVFPIAILDEFVVGADSNFSIFARNCLRALRFAVILTGTGSKVANLMERSIVDDTSREADRPWCFVISDLPKVDLRLLNIPQKFPDMLRDVITISRPWFAELAVKKFELLFENQEFFKLPERDKWDQVIGYCYETVADRKKIFDNPDGLHGQLNILLEASFGDSLEDLGKRKKKVQKYEVDLINKHFADFADKEKNFYITMNRKKHNLIDHKILSETPWFPMPRFPKPCEDCLLFLMLTGGLKPAFIIESSGQRIPYNCFRKKVLRLPKGKSNTENSAQKTESGIDWEAIFSVAFIVASHTFGVLGTPLKTFLSNLIFELCDWNCPEPPEIPDQMELKFLEELVIPFLSPPNQSWPDFLLNNRNKNQLNFANFRRPTNMESIDFMIDGHNVTGESKYHDNVVDVDIITQIYSNIPMTSRLHIVFVKKLQYSYFTTNTIEHYFNLLDVSPSKEQLDFVTNNCVSMKVYVPTTSSTGCVSFAKIPGLPSTETNQKCLVIFVVLRETVIAAASKVLKISSKP